MFMRILTWYIGLLFHYQLLTGSSYPSPILFARNRPITALWACHLSCSLYGLLLTINSALQLVFRTIQCIYGYLQTIVPHSLQIHVKLNLQLRNHLKINSVAALPHSIRWSTIGYSATSITTHKLDRSQATNFCVRPYKARIFSFSNRRPHGLSLQCWA